MRHLTTSLFTLAAFMGAPRASAVEIDVRCDRLRESEAEELAARARLILRANRIEPSSRAVLVGCTPTSSWVEWAGPTRARRLDVDERQGIVEGALDALDALVRRSQAAPEPDEEIAPPEAPAAPVAGVPSPRDPASPGGLGLAVAGEPIGAGELAVGPRLDVGFGAGAFTGFATEGFRLTTGSQGAVLIDTQLGANWGAPFAPEHPFGAAVSVGLEWLTAAISGGGASSGPTDSSVIFSAGPRARLRLDFVALWVGLDFKLRAAPQELGSPIGVSLAPASGLLTIGALFLVAGSEERRGSSTAERRRASAPARL